MPGAAAGDRRLLMEVEKGNLSGVKKLLAGGANVDGSRELEYPPIMGAARNGNAAMLKLLISKGADLETEARFPAGSRAIHAAISGENPTALSVLLEAGADFNSRDGAGETPLMLTALADTGALLARELFKVGASPFVKNADGMSAMHVAAGLGNLEVMTVILTNTPSALNVLDNKGFTPMGIAALRGQRRAVFHLLSAGASDLGVDEQNAAILWACDGGHPRMVRMMLEHGINRVGGLGAIPNSIGVAVQGRQAKILEMLVSAEGEENRRKWAECRLRDGTPLHLAAAWVSVRAIHVLLSAGARETLPNGYGKLASEEVGIALRPPARRSPRKEAAVVRMLQRGPAYRARSYGWPTLDGGNGTSDVTLSSRTRGANSFGVQIFRPTGTRFFATRFARYANK
ncbi:unnamed protein product [Ectocarpus sp. CCAP 1310/34]|nr:unnamed protein product [Ectocarpus sp. CCAP 1310/34]